MIAECLSPLAEQTQINTQALASIISGVEKALAKLKIKSPDPVKKAEFIAMCYEVYGQTDQEVPQEFIERHLRLAIYFIAHRNKFRLLHRIRFFDF